MAPPQSHSSSLGRRHRTPLPDIPESPPSRSQSLRSPSTRPQPTRPQAPRSQSNRPQAPRSQHPRSQSARPPPVPVVTPGPNAFAQHAAAVEHHRLQSNAFYQQEVAEKTRLASDALYQAAKRNVTPLIAVHPAHRQDFLLGDSSPHSIEDHNYTPDVSIPSPAATQTPSSPPLKLVPDAGFQGHPTDRGIIEDKREQVQHENSGSDTERTPVYTYTPKIDASEFSKSVGHNTPQKKKVGVFNWGTTSEQSKSPKKGFFEKLGMTGPRSAQASEPMVSPDLTRGFGGGEALPPKARAVLSSPPPKGDLSRSPSKKLGMFARKTSEMLFPDSKKTASRLSYGHEPRSADPQTVRFSDSAGQTHQTPQSAFTDPTNGHHAQAQRQVSQTRSEHGGDELSKDGSADTDGIVRAQSLQHRQRLGYIDGISPPPTPPAKNTPPHVRHQKAQEEKSRRILEHHQQSSERRIAAARKMTPTQMTPDLDSFAPKKDSDQMSASKPKSPLHRNIFENRSPARETIKLMGADGRTSPTKFGSYGHKHVAKLVKQPSVYSLHASFYPDLDDERTIEEVKRLADGLGLEGLKQLPEDFHNSEPRFVYSPSVYPDDFQASSDTLQSTGIFRPSPSLPGVLEHHRPMPMPMSTPSKASTHAQRSEPSSNGTIPFVYPELASDPNRMFPTESLKTHHRTTSEVQLPTHSRSYSHTTDSSSGDPSRRSLTSMLDKALAGASASPTKFSCPSAMPSPLKLQTQQTLQTLPNTTYTPPPRRRKKTEVEDGQEAEVERLSPGSTKTLTPSRSRGRIEAFKNNAALTAHDLGNPFDDVPSLQPDIKPFVSASLPVTASLVTLREPQKLDRSQSQIHSVTEDQQQQQQQAVPHASPESRSSMETMFQFIKAQSNQIAALKADIKSINEKKTQIDEVASLRAELKSMYAMFPQQPGPISPATTASVQIASPVSDDSTNTIKPLEQATTFVPQASLSQLALRHRTAQQRVYSEERGNEAADEERHDRSDRNRKASEDSSTANAMKQVIDLMGGIHERLQNLEGGSKRGK